MNTMQPTTPVSSVPVSQLDPYSDDALVEPWETYTALQNLGAAVWLEKYGMFALTRYDAVAKALRDWQAFPSSFGVMMNDDMNQLLRGNTLCSDGIAHKQLRQVVMRPITPAALASLGEEVEHEAQVETIVTGRWVASSAVAQNRPLLHSRSTIATPARAWRATLGDKGLPLLALFGH